MGKDAFSWDFAGTNRVRHRTFEGQSAYVTTVRLQPKGFTAIAKSPYASSRFQFNQKTVADIRACIILFTFP